MIDKPFSKTISLKSSFRHQDINKTCLSQTGLYRGGPNRVQTTQNGVGHVGVPILSGRSHRDGDGRTRRPAHSSSGQAGADYRGGKAGKHRGRMRTGYSGLRLRSAGRVPRRRQLRNPRDHRDLFRRHRFGWLADRRRPLLRSNSIATCTAVCNGGNGGLFGGSGGDGAFGGTGGNAGFFWGSGGDGGDGLDAVYDERRPATARIRRGDRRRRRRQGQFPLR